MSPLQRVLGGRALELVPRKRETRLDPTYTPQLGLLEEMSLAELREREARRGRRYDGIILDPPKYGRGPKGEIWRIEQDLVPLLAACRDLLSETPLFMLLTIYAIRASSQAAHYAMREVMQGGQVTSGELAVAEAQADPPGGLAPRRRFLGGNACSEEEKKSV